MVRSFGFALLTRQQEVPCHVFPAVATLSSLQSCPYLGAGLVPRVSSRGGQAANLAGYRAVAEILFGLLMNLYSWAPANPASAADVGLYWSPGLTLNESLRRNGAFYLATS